LSFLSKILFEARLLLKKREEKIEKKKEKDHLSKFKMREVIMK
jgi:hypothetical protein